MTVTLYKYAANPIIVDKTSYLQSPYAITGEVPEATQDVERPTLYFAFTSEPEYNYAYVAEWHRYYYIRSKTWLSGNVWSFQLEVDELYTYRALVTSLSGIFDYSTYGDSTKFDPRLNYNVPPTRTVLSPYTGDGGDTSFGIPMIALRHFTADYDATLVGQSGVQSPIAVEYMNTYAYVAFCEVYGRMLRNSSTESLAIAIGSSIIDVSVVYYSDVMASGATVSQNIIFDTPAVLNLHSYTPYTLDLTNSVDVNALLIRVYHAEVYNSVNMPIGKNFDFQLTNTNYWDRTAKRTVFLPYIGNIDIDVNQLGLGSRSSFNLRISVRHEPAENVYVVTPTVTTSPTVTFYLQRSVINVSTTMPLFTDTSFENKTKTEQIKMFNLISQGVAVVGSAAAYGMIFPGTAMHMVNNIFTTELELDNLKVADALSVKAVGTIGGSPDLITSHTGPYMEILATAPAQGYTQYWSRFGKPDGAFRVLAGYSGYVQMGQFEMIYNPNATIGEMTRLEAQLKQGVIL